MHRCFLLRDFMVERGKFVINVWGCDFVAATVLRDIVYDGWRLGVCITGAGAIYGLWWQDGDIMATIYIYIYVKQSSGQFQAAEQDAISISQSAIIDWRDSGYRFQEWELLCGFSLEREVLIWALSCSIECSIISVCALINIDLPPQRTLFNINS